MKGLKILSLVAILAAPLCAAQESFDRGLDAYLAGDYQQAYQIWKPLADGGDKVAMFNVGVLYAGGRGVSRNLQQAARWYRRAAEAGYAPAQFNLGSAYLEGNGVAADKRQAFAWWTKAAAQNHPQSLFNLATLYLQGDGVAADRAKALELYRQAAQQGDERAQKVIEQLAPSTASGGAEATAANTPAVASAPAESPGNAPAPSGTAATVNTPVEPSASSGSQRDAPGPSDEAATASTAVAPSAPDGSAGDAPTPGGDNPPASTTTAAAPVAGSADKPPRAAGVENGARREPWIQAQNPQHVTIQLVVYSNEQTIRQFIADHRLGAQSVAYFRVRRGQNHQYKLIYGTFASVKQAKAARESLPEAVKKLQPWIRPFAAVHAELEQRGPEQGKADAVNISPQQASAAKPVVQRERRWRRDAGAGADSEQIRIGQAAFNSQDYAKALAVWRPLAVRGVPAAQYSLGFMYESGWGVARNDQEAAGWYQVAADQGHAQAQFNLGRLYMEGRGVEKNKGLGLYWIQNAVDGDDQRAAEYLKQYQARR